MLPIKASCALLCALIFTNGSAQEQLESHITAPVLDEQAKEIEGVQDVRSEQAATQALQIHLGPPPDDVQEGGEDTDDQGPNGHRIGVHRSPPTAFIGNLTPQFDWTVDENGQHIAAATLTADGAVSLRIAVDVSLSIGGSIQMFDGTGTAHGPAYVHGDFSGEPPVWLPSVGGDTLTVQITLPSVAAVEALSFSVIHIAHRLETVIPQQATPDCPNHEDVACTDDERIRRKAKVTARISFEKTDGSYVCSGALLNAKRINEDDPFIPYFLTAYHCISNSTVAASVEARWFYRHARCYSSRIDSRSRTTYGGAAFLAGSPEQDAAFLRFKRTLPSGLWYSGWTNKVVPPGSSIYAVHHPNGSVARYSVGQFRGLRNTRLEGTEIMVIDGLRVNWEQGTTEGGSSGGGWYLDSRLIGVHSSSPSGEECSTNSGAGSFRDFYPHIKRWLSPDTRPIQISHLPLLSPASWYPSVRGIVRVVNSSKDHGYVTVYAIDDTGTRFDPFEIELGPMQASQFSSATLEDSIGEGEGFWRLEISTNLDIRAQAFMRFVDNNLAPMHDVIPVYKKTESHYWYHANKFFPDKHRTHVSWLRLSNPTASSLRVDMVSAPDRGGDYWSFDRGRSVWIRLRPHESRWLSSEHFEEGRLRLRGRLGALTQGHHLFIRSTRPLWVMNLMRNPTGRFFNLSTAQVSSVEETE